MGNNIIGKCFTSRPDLFQVDVFKILIKTKHRAVHVWQSANTNGCVPAINSDDQKCLLNDLRAHNIDSLRCAFGSHDWSDYLNCFDIQIVYDNFCTLFKRM